MLLMANLVLNKPFPLSCGVRLLWRQDLTVSKPKPFICFSKIISYISFTLKVFILLFATNNINRYCQRLAKVKKEELNKNKVKGFLPLL